MFDERVPIKATKYIYLGVVIHLIVGSYMVSNNNIFAEKIDDAQFE